MNILKPNNGKEIQYIANSHVYVKAWDYGKKFLLTHLKIPNMQSPLSSTVWTWLSLNEGATTDISEFSHSSFEDAINKAINNSYCTVYAFETYDEMSKYWKEIKYIDTIETTYRSIKDDN